MKQYAVIAAACATIALGGCKQEPAKPEDPALSAAPAASAEAVTQNGVSLSNARIQLPAVAGRPGVAYFDLSREEGEGEQPDFTITGVDVSGVGRTEMHETTTKDGVSSMKQVEKIALMAGDEVSFMPGGLHVMLFDSSIAANAEAAQLSVTVQTGEGEAIALEIPAAISKQGAADEHAGH